MLHTAHDILGRPVQGTLENLGTLSDLMLDCFTWDIRYLVVDTGNWLAGRQVLLAPDIIASSNWDEQHQAVHVPLTKQQLEASPSLESLSAVSRQHERDLADYFGWASYWIATTPGGPSPVGAEVAPSATRTATAEQESDLRSARDVFGYSIAATDGDLGHVDDFIVDLDHWIIRYLIIKTRNWLPGRSVLISPAWIEAVRWEDRYVRVHLSRSQIEASPEYDPDQPLDRQYEEALHKSYDRPRYWNR